MRKVIRYNKVAVILGDPWYTLHKRLDWLFLPELVNLIESEEYQKMTEEIDYFYRERKTQMVINCLLKTNYNFTEKDLDINRHLKESDLETLGDIDFGCSIFTSDKYLEDKFIGGDDLKVEWIDCNRDFSIRSSDYGEYILYKDDIDWLSISEEG